MEKASRIRGKKKTGRREMGKQTGEGSRRIRGKKKTG